jgi:hypothetical protein
MNATTQTGRVGNGRKVHAISANHAECGTSFRKGFGANRPVKVTGEDITCLSCLKRHGVEAPAAAPAEQAPTKTYCPNKGVVDLHRIYSTCKSCGREGKVLRGKLRQHEAKN